ncbi:MAG: AlwI family type II restriction endonuclease, partial [Sarcina sp.]
LNEQVFIKYTSKQEQCRNEILERFDSIIKGTEDMAALWLECNTWKSLVAIKGEHNVKRNFTMELDLTPRAFAPGTGNTPDMELYMDNLIILPEVSLMTGVRQWEHEASSVVDHVFRFIKEYESKNVIGLFISSKINIRTLWQFFILNKESWIGKPIPIIPLTLEQYKEIITKVYNNDIEINNFVNLLEKIRESISTLNNYTEWEKDIERILKEWLS